MTAVPEAESIAGAGQLVLELKVAVRGQPQEVGVLVELQVLCREAGEENVAFEALDLFLPESEGMERHLVFDLTAVVTQDSLLCQLQESALRLSPVAAGVSLVPSAGGPDGKLQVVRF